MHTQGFPRHLSLKWLVLGLLITGSAVPAQQLQPLPNGTDDSIYQVSPVATSLMPVETDAVRSVPISTEIARIQSALAAYEAMLIRNRTNGNRKGEAEALSAIASSYRALKQEHKALDSFQSELAIWRELDKKENEATTLGQIGDIYREWGFPEEAVRLYREALRIFPLTSGREQQAAALSNMGVAYLTLHNKGKCFDYFNQAMAIYEANQNEKGKAITLRNLGAAYMFFFPKEPEKALDPFQKSLEKLEVLDDRAGEANVLDMMGIVFLSLHNDKMATLTLQRALAFYHSLGDTRREAAVLGHLSHLGEGRRYRMHRIAAVSGATPDPVRLTAAHLQILEAESVD